MEIGKKSIEAMVALAKEQIETYAGKINQAFLKSEDSKLKVSLAFDLFPSEIKANGLDIDATISFVESKVKEKVSKCVVENQVEMPI